MQPLYVQLDPRDNVAIIANAGGLPAGATFPCGLTLTEAIPQAHKVALRDIEVAEAIIRYGTAIGHAKSQIAKGSWIRENLVTLPPAPRLDQLSFSTAVPDRLPALDGITFEGFRNADGSVGTKNILGITTTVQCVAPTVEFAVRRIKAEILPRYPGVDDVVAITHPYGCGVAINVPLADIPIRTIRNISQNPNLGGEAMVVSLGCEKLQPTRLFPDGTLRILDGEPWVVRMQDEEYRGFGDIVAAIMRTAEVRLEKLSRRKRVTCPASDLIVGLQCGGSDAFSGVTANPAVGYAADLLVRVGATVMFSEVTEIRDAVHLLAARAATPDVGRALVNQMAWYDDYLRAGSADRSANPSPGNKHGGLANIVEKALGSVAKAGSTALAGVSGPGERVTTKGLVFAATPASDFICGTLQTAAGMNMHVFTTGEGTPYGLAIVPVIKVSSRTALAERWPDLIDIDAGPIAIGEATIQQLGQRIFDLILEVASGRTKTWADHWGLHNPLALFNPAPVT
jgi:galactarate dehydratase